MVTNRPSLRGAVAALAAAATAAGAAGGNAGLHPIVQSLVVAAVTAAVDVDAPAAAVEKKREAGAAPVQGLTVQAVEPALTEGARAPALLATLATVAPAHTLERHTCRQRAYERAALAPLAGCAAQCPLRRLCASLTSTNTIYICPIFAFADVAHGGHPPGVHLNYGRVV